MTKIHQQTEQAADPFDGDRSAVGKGGVSTKLRDISNKGRDDGVTYQDALPGADLKPGMTTPPRWELLAMGHVVLEGR